MRLPDFYIIGAPKCATTDLCHQLSKHESVYLSSPKEPNFFCRDDYEALPFLLFENPSEWAHFDWQSRRIELLTNYSRLFDQSPSNALCGEGTPVYLYSLRAATRIKEETPNAKIIVVLREPVSRAWSHYWHNIRMRRATLPFEEHLWRERDNALKFGCYETPLERYYSLFGGTQILPLVFEEYVKNRPAVVSRILDWLGAAPVAQELAEESRRREIRNQRVHPASQEAQLALNRLAVRAGAHYQTIEYAEPRPRTTREVLLSKAIRATSRLNEALGRLSNAEVGPVPPQTASMLRAFYQRENRGLAALTGLDLSKWWDW